MKTRTNNFVYGAFTALSLLVASTNATKASTQFDLAKIPSAYINRFQNIVDTNHKQLIYAQYQEQKKDVTMGYLSFIFLGSGYHLYLGRIGYFFLHSFLNLIVVGLIWSLIDLFRMQDLVKQANEEIFDKLLESYGY